ncbi:MAG: hypothetical protein ACTS6G_01170 [Candidatus Hodgkinia cicadicola]
MKKTAPFAISFVKHHSAVKLIPLSKYRIHELYLYKELLQHLCALFQTLFTQKLEVNEMRNQRRKSLLILSFKPLPFNVCFPNYNRLFR